MRFYSNEPTCQKKVMTIPLLKILGHEINKFDWSAHSKSVVWTACCVGFFGSFRFGELLSSNETSFNKYETLMWSDISFIENISVRIHNKIPKTRIPNGEFISLFEFPHFNCCPIKALLCLKQLSECENMKSTPVFSFKNGTLLTLGKMNTIITSCLSPHIGVEASNYSCKSFRAGLPSALAAYPHLENEVSIKRWGRWNSNAYERYTRLNHNAKKALFEKFAKALKK